MEVLDGKAQSRRARNSSRETLILTGYLTDRTRMDPLILGVLFFGSLSLAVATARGVLGIVVHAMDKARPRHEAARDV